MLSPSSSKVRQLYIDTNLSCVRNIKGGPAEWDPQLQCFMAGDDFSAFAISKDGQTMAVATVSNLRLWDVRTGILKQEIAKGGHTSALSFSDGGKSLASVSKKGLVQLWDTETGIASTQCTLAECGDLLTASLLPSQSLVTTVSCNDARAVDVWELTTGPRRLTLTHDSDVKDVALSPDGSIVAALIRGDSIQMWSTTTGGHYYRIPEVPDLTAAITFSPDGVTLASASPKSVCFWSATRDIHHQTLTSQRPPYREIFGYPESIAFFPACDRLAVCDIRSVTVWDVPTWTYQQNYRRGLPPHQNAEIIASNLFDRQCLSGDSTTNSKYGSISNPDFIITIAMSPDQKTIASSSLTHSLLLWDIETGTLQSSLPNSNRPVQKLAFSPDGNILAVASYDSDHKEFDLELYEITQSRSLWSHKGSAGGILMIEFSPDGGTLAVALERKVRLWPVGTVQLWKVATGKVQWQKDWTEGVQLLAFSPDGRVLGVASGRTVSLLRVAGGTPLKELDCTTWLPRPFLGLSGMVFSQSSELLGVAPCFESRVVLWNVSTGHVRTLHADSKEYFRLMVPDAKISVQVPWIIHASRAIVLLPPTYENHKAASVGSRIVMGNVDGEFIILDFDLAQLNNL